MKHKYSVEFVKRLVVCVDSFRSVGKQAPRGFWRLVFEREGYAYLGSKQISAIISNYNRRIRTDEEHRNSSVVLLDKYFPLKKRVALAALSSRRGESHGLKEKEGD